MQLSMMKMLLANGKLARDFVEAWPISISTQTRLFILMLVHLFQSVDGVGLHFNFVNFALTSIFSYINTLKLHLQMWFCTNAIFALYLNCSYTCFLIFKQIVLNRQDKVAKCWSGHMSGRPSYTELEKCLNDLLGSYEKIWKTKEVRIRQCHIC